ncbi:MAG TPA: hypothetical protein VNZ94_17255 [Xanthobacteraceae bacterium]|nr:hypothetical protein [Xanthobacteraceae bacterium]
MKKAIFSAMLATGLIALSSMDAGAVVCARGVYRAGCVAAAPRAAVVAPRAAVVAPPRTVVRRTTVVRRPAVAPRYGVRRY